MSDEIKKIDEISETQNAPEIKKEKKSEVREEALEPVIVETEKLSCGCCRRRVCAQFILQN